MSERAANRLYDLLPAIHRMRDFDRGEPLRALLSVVEAELRALEADIEGLYDDWFIETCADWVVPYIGDLIGARRLESEGGAHYSARAWVANTLRYRRRKGTAPVIEQIAFDVTRWRSRAVEYFERLQATQHVNHVRPASPASADLRCASRLELVGGPFESATHTVEVRRIVRERGRYNIRNLGVFLWRLQPYPVSDGVARPVEGLPAGLFRFDPFGRDTPLFNRPQPEDEITHLAEESNVPAPLRRRALYDELEARRLAVAAGRTPKTVYFPLETPDGDGRLRRPPVLSVHVDGEDDPIPPEKIAICDLRDPATPIAEGWRRPPDGLRVGVDPELGRIAFREADAPDTVRVRYAYGFSADVGGGPYEHGGVLRGLLERRAAGREDVAFQILVTRREPPAAGQVVATLGEAVSAWNAFAQGQTGQAGVIVVGDGETYGEALTGAGAIVIPSECRLYVIAAAWPSQPGEPRELDALVPSGVRPHLLGDLAVRGDAPGQEPGDLLLDGLWIEGRAEVLAGNLGGFELSHCTLHPALGGVAVADAATQADRNPRLALRLSRSICGPVSLAGSTGHLEVVESIVDAGAAGAAAVRAPEAEVEIETSTLFGTLEALVVDVGNSIVTGLVTVERRQRGCVRYSFVPDGSRTPRRFRTQPELALQARAVELDLEFAALPPVERASVLGRVRPQFNSSRHGDPDYAQLSRRCAAEIRTGADDGSEMGVFGILKQQKREANLRAGLEEYLRVGLEAGFFRVT